MAEEEGRGHHVTYCHAISYIIYFVSHTILYMFYVIDYIYRSSDVL